MALIIPGRPLHVAQDRVVTIHYVLRDEEGAVRDASRDASGHGDALPYLHGHGNIVPGLEAALNGKVAGDRLREVRVPPEQGYGIDDPELNLALPLEMFPPEMHDGLEPGQQFMAEHPTDESRQVMYTIVGQEGDEVLVTGNHPLAGDVLIFDVEIVEVREATAEELAHGHVHGPGGHH